MSYDIRLLESMLLFCMTKSGIDVNAWRLKCMDALAESRV